MIKASVDLAGPQARWEPWWTCELLHRAEQVGAQALAVDPAALVISLVCYPGNDESAPVAIVPGHYSMGP